MPPQPRLDAADLTKRPNSKSRYEDQQALDLFDCADDPLFFMRNFMRVQHPTKGAIPFVPFEFQEEMVKQFETNRFNVVMTARQMGKCSTFATNIKCDDEGAQIGTLITPKNVKERTIGCLERILLRLATWKSSPSEGS